MKNFLPDSTSKKVELINSKKINRRTEEKNKLKALTYENNVNCYKPITLITINFMKNVEILNTKP